MKKIIAKFHAFGNGVKILVKDIDAGRGMLTGIVIEHINCGHRMSTGHTVKNFYYPECEFELMETVNGEENTFNITLEEFVKEFKNKEN